MRLEYTHKLGKEQAYAKLEKIKEVLIDEWGHIVRNYSYSWSPDHSSMDFEFYVLGQRAKGNVYLNDVSLVVEGPVPLVVRFALSESAIERMARKELDRLFGTYYIALIDDKPK